MTLHKMDAVALIITTTTHNLLPVFPPRWCKHPAGRWSSIVFMLVIISNVVGGMNHCCDPFHCYRLQTPKCHGCCQQEEMLQVPELLPFEWWPPPWPPPPLWPPPWWKSTSKYWNLYRSSSACHGKWHCSRMTTSMIPRCQRRQLQHPYRHFDCIQACADVGPRRLAVFSGPSDWIMRRIHVLYFYFPVKPCCRCRVRVRVAARCEHFTIMQRAICSDRAMLSGAR